MEGRLGGAPVFLLGMRAVDRQMPDGFATTLEGTVWLTSKWTMADDKDARQMAALLDAPLTTGADELRAAAIARVTGGWASGGGGAFVAALRDAAFVEFEPPAEPVAPLSQLPTNGSMFVVVSADSAEVPSEQLAGPLTSAMSQAGIRLLAAQPERPPVTGRSPVPEVPEFVGALRRDSDVAPRISTVDNLNDYRGRVAAVWAIEGLRTGRTGHYGFGPDAQRLVPEQAS
ncbi:MAG: copper transporter [Acidimicrobiales bacterium]